nr:MAG TPA: receptor binding protein [Caudoviricetes sp.]
MFPTLCKLENLSKVQQTKLYVYSEATGTARTTCNIVQKAGNVVTIVFDSGDALRYINDNTVIFSIPENYRPKSFLSVNASQFNGTAGTIYIQPDGTAKWKGQQVTTASIIFSVSYITD